MAWQPWDGSRPFKGDKPIKVRWRNGKIAGTHAGETILPACKWNGQWSFGPDWPWDIIEVLPAD